MSEPITLYRYDHTPEMAKHYLNFENVGTFVERAWCATCSNPASTHTVKADCEIVIAWIGGFHEAK